MASTVFQNATDAATAMDLLENKPLATKLFEAGRLPLNKLTDAAYVNAVEQSMQARNKRIENEQLKDPTTSSSRQARRVERPRTVMSTQYAGVYKYRRPHFDTAPMYKQQGQGLGQAVKFLGAVGSMTIGSRKSKAKHRSGFAKSLVTALG